MCPLAMYVSEPGRGSSVPIDLFTDKRRVVTKFRRSDGQVDLEWWPRLARCDYGEVGGSMERCIEVKGAQLTNEVTRVLLGVQGGDGGGRVVAWW
ncbi:hypothetical protein Tco_1437730 [Tanacetum coccineum]